MYKKFALLLLRIAGVAACLSVVMPARAQEKVIPLWPGEAPGSEKWTRQEATTAFGNEPRVRNVVRPTLTPFLPKQGTGNGTAVIVAPGGGFRFLSWESEGTKVAQWLSEHGIAAFVLKYRLVDTGATDEEFRQRLQAMVQLLSRPSAGEGASGLLEDPETKQVIQMAAEDGRQALRVLRRRAAEWGVAPDRIGIMGFSAGSMVATQAALQHDADSRPNFVGAIYGPPIGEYNVPADAPLLFILCADDDQLAARGSARLYTKWKEAGKTAELHIYSKGGHGFGMTKRGLPVDSWIERFGQWLDVQGLMKHAR
jgi:acetyl esterase/lipase